MLIATQVPLLRKVMGLQAKSDVGTVKEDSMLSTAFFGISITFITLGVSMILAC